MPNVWTGGVFDTIHPGHANLFKYCKELAGPMHSVTVAINTDEFVLKYKGSRPVQSLEERYIMVAALKGVDFVQINDGSNQPLLIMEAKTDAIVIGDDWKTKDYLTQLDIDKVFLVEHRIRIHYIERTYHSSTELKNRIKEW